MHVCGSECVYKIVVNVVSSVPVGCAIYSHQIKLPVSLFTKYCRFICFTVTFVAFIVISIDYLFTKE